VQAHAQLPLKEPVIDVQKHAAARFLFCHAILWHKQPKKQSLLLRLFLRGLLFYLGYFIICMQPIHQILFLNKVKF
jgi:hypothetical protein